MTQFLRRGRLEVETDLLLGAEDVLLPAVFPASVAGGPIENTRVEQPASARPRGFDADLFAPAPRERAPAQRPRPVATSTPSVVSIPAPAGGPGTTAAIKPILDRVVPPSGPSNADRLAALDRVHASECPHCTTATGHASLVFGEGNPGAELVFVGEAPGETEDRTGRPFVGPAGEKLDEMIAAMGLRREDVYIANVLKSRPPDNRTPLASEVERCGPYLLAQLAIIRPKAIVTLGGPATKLLLASELGITRLRGIPAPVRLGEAEGAPFDVPVMPTFHPAYLLRNYTVETRGQVWSDLKQALAMIGREPPKRG
jgi:DNA polymerase